MCIRDSDVTVIEFRDTVGADVIHEHRVYLMKDFEDYKIKEITGEMCIRDSLLERTTDRKNPGNRRCGRWSGYRNENLSER